MPSDIERAIAAQRKRLNAMDAEARARMRIAYEHATDRITRELDDVVRALETFPDSEWRMYHERRLRTLLDMADAEYARFADEGARILQTEQARAVRGGAQTAQEMAAASGISQTAFGVAINRQALERLVSSFAPGSPLRGVLESYGSFGRKVIERELTDALVGGKSPREASRTIRKALGGKGMKTRVDALTRTELLRAYRGSLGEQLSVFKRPGDKYRWVSARGPRVCLSCLYRDGKLYDEPPTQQHINCRCTFHLVGPEDQDAYETGEEWFARQPEAVQRQMIPSNEAHAAYQRGDITLRDFSGQKRDRVWGTTYYERSGRQALARGGKR